jgi:hypothetical protein
MELSILCGIHVNLILEDVTHQKLVLYQSEKGADLFTNPLKKFPAVREFYYNSDVTLQYLTCIKYESGSFKKPDIFTSDEEDDEEYTKGGNSAKKKRYSKKKQST